MPIITTKNEDSYASSARVARALLFSLLLSLPTIAELSLYSSDSPRAFTDIDEVSYLPKALFAAEGKSSSAIYFEHDTSRDTIELLLGTPNVLVEVIVGSFGVFFYLFVL